MQRAESAKLNAKAERDFNAEPLAALTPQRAETAELDAKATRGIAMKSADADNAKGKERKARREGQMCSTQSR